MTIIRSPKIESEENDPPYNMITSSNHACTEFEVESQFPSSLSGELS